MQPPVPRIAVVTPYFQEPLETLAQCHRSVLAQDVRADHIMVADGYPSDEVARWKVRHVTLPAAHGDFGCAARGVGSLLADVEGYDFVAFLDADNWYHPGHLSSLLEIHRKNNAPVCTSFRTFHRPDGSELQVTEADEDNFRHVDTSCLLLHRAAFEVLPVWMRMPRQVSVMCDRVFLGAIRDARLPAVSSGRRTVAYRTLYETHYMGQPLPVGYKPRSIMQPAMDWLSTPQGVAESVARLGFWPVAYL